MSKSLENAIRDKSALVGVIGMGYVGLPLINAFVSAGFRTLGFDVDQRKVDALNAGTSYIKHIDSKIVSKSAKGASSRRRPRRRLEEADALLICVPTPLNEARSRLALRRADRASDCGRFAARSARRPGKYHLSHDDPGRRASDPQSQRLARGQRLLSGL